MQPDEHEPVSRRRWGYWYWGAVAVAIGGPEIYAAAAGGNGPWPTISSCVGKLERSWTIGGVFFGWLPPIVVVALIVVTAMRAVRFRDDVRAVGGRARLGRHGTYRTPGGRRTRTEMAEGVDTDLGSLGRAYAVLVPLLAIFATVIVGVTTDSSTDALQFRVGYALFLTIAFFCVVLPTAAAYWFKKDVPFPPFYQTMLDIEAAVHWLGVLFLCALAVLLIHLALYPWPNVAGILQQCHGHGSPGQTLPDYCKPGGS